MIDEIALVEKTVTIFGFADFISLTGYIIAIVLAISIFEFIITGFIDVVRKITVKKKSISDVENIELLQAINFSEKGKKFLRGRKK